MAPDGRKTPSVKEQPRRGSPLTVMILGRVGQVRSFEISPYILLWAALFFLAYVPTSAFFFGKYLLLYGSTTAQSKKIELLEEEVLKGKKDLHQSQQQVALVKAYKDHLKGPQKPRNASSKAQDSGEGGVVPSEAERVVNVRDDGEKSAGVVDIKDMMIQKEGTRMRVAFKLVNMNPDEKAVEGYIHMIAMGKKEDSPPGTFPRVKVKEGVPVDFRRGQLFRIQWSKPVRGRFSFPPNSEPPAAIRVLVYDQSGVLLLEKEFEVRHVS